jgi:hypothetical protein
VAASIAIAVAGDPARHLGWVLWSLGLGFLWLVFAARRLERRGRVAAGGVLLVAALVRLPLIAVPPTLSDDVVRYLWDGRVAAAGFNPYRLAPEDPRLAPLRDDLWRRLPHRQVPTVYPPLAVAAFSIAARLPAPVTVWKAAVTAVDLGAVALLGALAAARGVSRARVALYAWNPLVALEVAGMGHVDALGVAAVVAAALLLTRRPGGSGEVAGDARPGVATPGAAAAAAAVAAAGALGKLAPLAAIPVGARPCGRPARFALGAVGLAAAAAAPVVVAPGLPSGAVTYGVSWEYNGPLYEPLWRAIDRLDLDGAVARTLERIEERTGHYRAFDRVYPWVYPQLLAKALLALGMAVALVRSLGARDPLAGSGRLFGTLLVFSATFYPWYLLWVLPWAALDRRPAWLALSALLPLAYLPQVTGMAQFPAIHLAIWGPFFLIAAGERLAVGRRPSIG